MSNDKFPEIIERIISEDTAEIIGTRNRHLQNFADWMIQSGLSPLDYELVEERRSDGVIFWYFRRRSENEEIQEFNTIES